MHTGNEKDKKGGKQCPSAGMYVRNRPDRKAISIDRVDCIKNSKELKSAEEKNSRPFPASAKFIY